VEPQSNPNEHQLSPGDGPEPQLGVPKITIRGSISSAAKTVRDRLAESDLLPVIQSLRLNGDPSVIVDSKSSHKSIVIEMRQESLHVSIPARGVNSQKLGHEVVMAVIGFAVKERALEAAEQFVQQGALSSTLSGQVENLLRQYGKLVGDPRVERSGLLYKALAPHRAELERLQKNLSEKIKTAPSLSADGLIANTELFLQRLGSFRAVSELLGASSGLADLMSLRIRERLMILEDIFARGLLVGNYTACAVVVEGMESILTTATSAGWFKAMPKQLQAVQSPYFSLNDPQALLNQSLWPGSSRLSSGPVTMPSAEATAETLICGLTNIVAGLKFALATDKELRTMSFGAEAGLDLLDALISVAPQMPAIVTSLGAETTDDALAEVDEFLRLLLQIKYCNQAATANLYEYVVYGVIPDEEAKRMGGVRAELAARPNFQVVQCLALISTGEAGLAGERLALFREDLALISSRAIAALVYQFRAMLGHQLDTGAVFDQQTVRGVVSDLDAMENAMLIIVEHPQTQERGFGFQDIVDAIRTTRESYQKSALLTLTDGELAARVEEVLRLDHSGQFADQLREVSGRLVERMKSYAGVLASEAGEHLENLSRGESVIPLVEYAKEALSVVKADPTSEASTSLKASIGEVLLEMLRVLEEYYSMEIELAQKKDASAEDVYRALEAVHRLMIEATFVCDQLRPLAVFLPELILSKCQTLIDQVPKRMRRELQGKPAILEQVLSGLTRDISSKDTSVRAVAKGCVEGLRWLRISRAALTEPAKLAYNRLMASKS
jgi:hypothetical protein